MPESLFVIKRPTPILRIFDEGKARQFYIDFLGFNVDWEHRFEDDLPLYLQISQGDCILHLSGHHGDCSPGSAMRIEIDNANAYHSYLIEQKYKYARPGLETNFGCLEISVTDPFGNRLTFFERLVENV